MSRYSDIMHYLHPRFFIEHTQLPHDTARGKYVLNSSIVQSHLEFENCLIDYVNFHMRETLGYSTPPEFSEFSLDKARKFLESSIGFDNAVFIAMSGAEGGMHHVLNQVCEGFKKEAKQAYFAYVVDTFISPLNFEEIVEVMREFKEKLGNFSPQPFNYISPESMAAHYKEILWSYIENLSRYRNLWAY